MSLRIDGPDGTITNRQRCRDAIIAPSMLDDDARKRLPSGWSPPLSCIRLIQPPSDS